MLVWITKYALTQGILEIDVPPPSPDRTSMVVVPKGVLGSFACYFHKGDWHTTPAAAIERVHNVLTKRKAALERQLKNLDATSNKALTVKVIKPPTDPEG
jgi:hypothetical protein